MITLVLVALVLPAPGYYFALVWVGLAFAFFQVRLLSFSLFSQLDEIHCNTDLNRLSFPLFKHLEFIFLQILLALFLYQYQ